LEIIAEAAQEVQSQPTSVEDLEKQNEQDYSALPIPNVEVC